MNFQEHCYNSDSRNMDLKGIISHRQLDISEAGSWNRDLVALLVTNGEGLESLSRLSFRGTLNTNSVSHTPSFSLRSPGTWLFYYSFIVNT